MKILYFTKYSRLGASSRMRSFQYFPFLEKQGVEIKANSLFGDEYLALLNLGKKSLSMVVKAYFYRLWILISIYKYDKVVIEKELFPYIPAFFEWILYLCKVKYIVDYDDAIFHNYDQHPNPWIRRFLHNKIDKVMKYSHAVVAGNDYLANRALQAGAKKAIIIPTVVDIDRYTIKTIQDKVPIIIGWIGTKSTYEKHLSPKVNLIKKAIAKYKVEFHIVGVSNSWGPSNNIKYIPWTETTEVDSILKFDIGIMPLEDSLWEKGKCSYKLIQYMACGLPVIASPVGMNNDVVKDNLNGFLAYNDEAWLRAIELYVKDVGLRSIHGNEGRRMVEQQFCLQVTSQQLIKVIRL